MELNDMPESILIRILSELDDSKEVVRTCVLSKQWLHLWKSVPVSLYFYQYDSSEEQIADFVASTSRELYCWRSCHNHNIPTFEVSFPDYEERYAKDVDLWVHFATQVAIVQDFTLLCNGYELPQFAYENTSLRFLVLYGCQLAPSGTVNWTSLVSLSVEHLNLTDGVMENILCGCPNVEILKIDECFLYRLEVPNSSMKLRDLIIHGSSLEVEDEDLWIEISAPFVQNLQLSGTCHGIRLRNVTSLLTARLHFRFAFEDEENNLEMELMCLNELLHSVAHVQNLELGPWCIECMSILELGGWQFPPSRRKVLKINATLKQWDSAGVCSFLQSSSDLETLVIHWDKYGSRELLSRYTNEDEQSRRFETRNLNCSLQCLKTINFFASLSSMKYVLPLAKYLLKNANAVALESFIIDVVADYVYGWSHDEYIKKEEELLNFPRSSPVASVVFSYK